MLVILRVIKRKLKKLNLFLFLQIMDIVKVDDPDFEISKLTQLIKIIKH